MRRRYSYKDFTPIEAEFVRSVRLDMLFEADFWRRWMLENPEGPDETDRPDARPQ